MKILVVEYVFHKIESGKGCDNNCCFGGHTGEDYDCFCTVHPTKKDCNGGGAGYFTEVDVSRADSVGRLSSFIEKYGDMLLPDCLGSDLSEYGDMVTKEENK